MNFGEYEKMIRSIPATESLEYHQAIMWLHPEILPVGVASIGEKISGVVKVPEFATNKYGKRVPVIAIRREAFAGQDKITDVVLPPGIRRFPKGAFAGCTALQRIIIPKSIKRIEEGTFAGCTSLEDVYYEGSMEEWKEVEIIHQKHEIEFGELLPGTPVQKVTAERLVYVPGNEPLFMSNIHFGCSLVALTCSKEFMIRSGKTDITGLFRTM